MEVIHHHNRARQSITILLELKLHATIGYGFSLLTFEFILKCLTNFVVHKYIRFVLKESFSLERDLRLVCRGIQTKHLRRQVYFVIKLW